MQVFNRLNKVGINIANTSEMRHVAYEIRRQVYADELGWCKPRDIIDELDAVSTQFLATVNQTMVNSKWVSSGRMVSPSAEFELERHVRLTAYRKQGRCSELGRLCILSEYHRSVVALAMFHGFYRYALSKNIRFFCVAATLTNHLYRNLGFVQFGSAFCHDRVNQMVYPYVLDLHKAPEIWLARRPKLLAYFSQPIDGIG